MNFQNKFLSIEKFFETDPYHFVSPSPSTSAATVPSRRWFFNVTVLGRRHTGTTEKETKVVGLWFYGNKKKTIRKFLVRQSNQQFPNVLHRVISNHSVQSVF